MRQYIMDDVALTEVEFIKELLYELFQERKQSIGMGYKGRKLTLTMKVVTILNNDSKSTFFEAGKKIFKCYEGDTHMDVWMDWKYDPELPILLLEGDIVRFSSGKEYTVLSVHAPMIRVTDDKGNTGSCSAFSIEKVLRKKV